MVQSEMDGESLLPEVGHAVECGLLVEHVFLCVHDDGTVHKVLHPVGPATEIQSQVPVRPTSDIVIQILSHRWGQNKEEMA